MNFSNKYSIILISCLLITCTLNAQQLPTDTGKRLPLSIAQVWQRAEVNSKAIQIKQLRITSSQEAIKDAQAERLPEININGEYARVSNMPVYENGLFHTPSQFPVLHATYTVGAEAYLNIYSGNKVNLEVDARKTENNIAGEQKNLTVSEIKLHAAAYYLDMQRSLIFKDLLLKDIEAQEKQLSQIKTLQKNGVVLKSDVLRAELKLSKQKLSLTQLDNDLAIANQKLNIIIGLTDEQQIIPFDSVQLNTIRLKPYNDYLTDAAKGAYQLKISEQETALRQLQLKNVKANVSGISQIVSSGLCRLPN